jgi:hypothetical protein
VQLFSKTKITFQVASALDDNPKSGWAVDPQFGKNHAAVFEFDEGMTPDVGAILEVRLEFSVNTRHNIGRPRISVTTHRNADILEDVIPSKVAQLLLQIEQSGNAGQTLSKEDRQALMRWWKTTDPGWQSLFEKEQKHASLKPKPNQTKVLVCAEGFPAVRMHTQGADFFEQTYFLKRGSTNSKGDVVDQGFIQALLPAADFGNPWKYDPPEGAKYSGRRRALAEWMTDVENGAGNLLARVIVNRLWQHHFGKGLVATPNDFGVFGEQPAHPELLDWLAVQLIKNQWRLETVTSPHHDECDLSTNFGSSNIRFTT